MAKNKNWKDVYRKIDYSKFKLLFSQCGKLPTINQIINNTSGYLEFGEGYRVRAINRNASSPLIVQQNESVRTIGISKPSAKELGIPIVVVQDPELLERGHKEYQALKERPVLAKKQKEATVYEVEGNSIDISFSVSGTEAQIVSCTGETEVTAITTTNNKENNDMSNKKFSPADVRSILAKVKTEEDLLQFVELLQWGLQFGQDSYNWKLSTDFEAMVKMNKDRLKG